MIMMDELKKKLTPNCTEGLLKNLKEFIRLSAAAPAEMMLSIPAQITSAIISILNNPQQSGKNKVSVLLYTLGDCVEIYRSAYQYNTRYHHHLQVLANLAKSPDPAHRFHIFSSLQGLTKEFENNLLDKEIGAKEFGTGLGALHELFLVTLLRASQFLISAKDLLTFVNMDLGIALLLVTSILRVPTYEGELLQKGCQLLLELAQPNTYRGDDSNVNPSNSKDNHDTNNRSNTGSGNNGDMEHFNIQEMKMKLNQLAHMIRKQNIIARVSEGLNKRINMLLRKEKGSLVPVSEWESVASCVSSFCTLLFNLHVLSSEVDILQHAIVSTPFLPKVLFVFVDYIIQRKVTQFQQLLSSVSSSSVSSSSPSSPPLPMNFTSSQTTIDVALRRSLEFLIFATFRPSTSQAMTQQQCVLHKSFAFQLFSAALAFMTDHADNSVYVFRALLPFDLASLLLHLMTNIDALKESDDSTSTGILNTVNVTHSMRRDTIEAYLAVASSVPFPLESKTSNSTYLDAMFARFTKSGHPSMPIAKDQATYQYLQRVFKETASSSSLSSSTPSASSSSPSSLTSSASSSPLSFTVNTSVPKSLSTNSSKSSKSGSCSRPSLSLSDLGSLPSIAKSSTHASTLPIIIKPSLHAHPSSAFSLTHKSISTSTFKSKSSSKSKPKAAAPTQLLCGINQHIMKHPVVTPLGHHFEKTTIESWLKTRGKVCPISGAVLTLEMLKPDRELETEILKYHFQSMMMSSNNDADEDDDALYSF